YFLSIIGYVGASGTAPPWELKLEQLPE
ncbi:MAG: hypothetical protein ACI8PZ_004579, partial [Myxococcota bacterium]